MKGSTLLIATTPLYVCDDDGNETEETYFAECLIDVDGIGYIYPDTIDVEGMEMDAISVGVAGQKFILPLAYEEFRQFLIAIRMGRIPTGVYHWPALEAHPTQLPQYKSHLQ